jgi:replicative DNA helicase
MFDLEQHIIGALLVSRKAYEKVALRLDLTDFSEVGRFIVKRIGDYYDRDKDASTVDRPLLCAMLAASVASAKQAEDYRNTVMALPTKASASNVAQLYRDLHARSLFLQAMQAFSNGKPEARELARAYLEASEEQGDDAEVEGTQVGFADIFDSAHAAKLRVLPESLNETLRGGIRPGNCIIVFGRPGAGKTLVTINMVSGLAHDGHKVLYIGNEESKQSIAFRFLSRFSNIPLSKLDSANEAESREAVTRALELANKRGYKNVHIVHNVTTLAGVRSCVARIKPRVLVLDQVRHINAAEALHQSLEIVTRELRKMAHEHGLIGIGVTQAGEGAEGKPVLTLTHIDGAKTGLQGACDLMIGVGPTDDATKRWLSICRNKISGVIRFFPVTCDEQTTRIIA